MTNTIRHRIVKNNEPLFQVIGDILPDLRGKINDQDLAWLSFEIQGFINTMDYYQQKPNSLPNFRIVQGKIYLVSHSGEFSNFEHPFANRTHYFVSSPIEWLHQAMFEQKGDFVICELPDLTTMFKMPNHVVALEFSRVELSKILYNVRLKFLEILDTVVQ